MSSVLKRIVLAQVKGVLKDMMGSTADQWILRKEIRKSEADRKNGFVFNPKTSRTRSFQ
jgi:hypothetical protein